MTLFSLIGLSLSIFCLVLSLIISYFAKTKAQKIWAIFNLVVALWGLGTYFAGISNSTENALAAWKWTYVFATFISVIFYHLTHSFCELTNHRFLIFSYLQGALFTLLILFSNLFINSITVIYQSIYYHNALLLFSIWLSIWGTITIAAFLSLWRYIQIISGIKKIQALYLFWSMILGFIGGTSSVLPAYGVKMYPFWQASICFYMGGDLTPENCTTCK